MKKPLVQRRDAKDAEARRGASFFALASGARRDHRQRLVVCLVAALAVIASAKAGTIAGSVRAQGKEGADVTAAGGKYDSRKFKFTERIDYSEMNEFVVYLEGVIGTNAAPPEKPAQVVTNRRISQKGAMFSPHILPVVAGTTVEWPNHDEIFHNVFSISETKPFDLGLYKHPEVKRVTFEKPGRVDAFCSIHRTMNCVILVLENPYFAATDERGRYSIPHVPPGTYKLKAWHERLPSQSSEITVPESGEVRMDFTLGITNLPKY
jgi:plastocyanin